MDYIKQLKDLRNKLASDQMSLLVGSGFSKNVSDKFLTWDELLFDLTYELYQKEIESAYDQYAALAKSEPLSEPDFIVDKCKQIIKKNGYLEIVSEYIKGKGYPESIATYIEERTPGIFKKKDAYILDCNGVEEELPRERLVLHKDLIDLPWNNIYTTNYDDLLDICVDQEKFKNLTDDIDLLEKEIISFNGLIKEKEDERENISRKTKVPETDELAKSPLEDLMPADPISPKEAQDKIRELDFKINSLKKQKLQQEQQVREKELELNGCHQIVKDATGLRLKKTRNIIKLHGSLRSKAERDSFYFQFDNDHKKQYVIAREDYESYPEKHEAFTQLMRISLLQESFCLIGFSGVDPNFLQWIGWVRDILHKEAQKAGTKKTYKIYLIDAGNSEVSRDKQLFYENHNIVSIPLQSPEVKAIFNNDLLTKVEITDRRSAIEALLIFLGNDNSIKINIPSANIAVRNERKNIWDALPIYEPDKIPDEETIRVILNRLKIISGKIWLPDLSFGNTHNQHSLLGYVNLQNWQQQLPQRPLLLQLVNFAAQDLFVPLKSSLTETVIAKLLEERTTKPITLRLLSRNNALMPQNAAESGSPHDKILRLAYSFQFKAMRQQLENWDAKNRELIQKAGMLALLDRTAAANLLANAIKDDHFIHGEEKLYALELLNYTTQPKIFGGDKKILRLIEAYEKSGMRSFQDNLDFLQKQIVQKAPKPAPFGDDRFTTSRSLHFSKHSAAEMAVQYLMLLAESGFQLTLHHVYLQSSDDWYPIFKAGFEFYPYPFLFYSLQYTNKDFLKKVGQDYAYSKNESVISELPKICEYLFSSLYDAPKGYDDNIMIFLSKFMIGVDPGVWQHHFFAFWQKMITEKTAFLKHPSDSHPPLIIAAIQYVNNDEIILKIVHDCLFEVINGVESQPINFLYQLNKNIYFKNLSNERPVFGDLVNLIDKVINGLQIDKIDHLFALGNIYRLLSYQQINSITKKLINIDLNGVKNARIWPILLYFAQDVEELKANVKTAITQNKNLWHTGIVGYSISRSLTDEVILLSRITFSTNHLKGLKWSDSELDLLFEKLKINLIDIERLSVLDDKDWVTFTGVLEEMVEFLTFHQEHLRTQPDYEVTKDTASNLLNVQRNYSDLEEGLTSKDQTEVLTALAELSVNVYTNQYDINHVTLVLNKILLQSEPALEASLSYIESWFRDKKYPARFKSQEVLLLRILKKYKTRPLPDCDSAYVDEKLISIAYLLKLWGNQSEIIAEWITLAETSHYNNVKQFISMATEKFLEEDDD